MGPCPWHAWRGSLRSKGMQPWLQLGGEHGRVLRVCWTAFTQTTWSHRPKSPWDSDADFITED